MGFTPLSPLNNLSDVSSTTTALNNLLPTQSGNSGKFLKTDGSGNISWDTAGGITGSGASGQIAYFNGSGTITGDSKFLWDPTNYSLNIGGSTQSANSTFIGQDAGDSSTNVTYSNFIGYQAGSSVSYPYNFSFLSNFMGYRAGAEASYAGEANFIGENAGDGATYAYQSQFFGAFTGTSAENADSSIFVGNSAGYQATSAAKSVFVGTNAGSQAGNAAHSIFIGFNSGVNDSVDNTGWNGTSNTDNSILIGDNTSTGGFSNSIALGAGATNTAAHQFYLSDDITQFHVSNFNWDAGNSNFFVGRDAGTVGVVQSNFLGEAAPAEVLSSAIAWQLLISISESAERRTCFIDMNSTGKRKLN